MYMYVIIFTGVRFDFLFSSIASFIDLFLTFRKHFSSLPQSGIRPKNFYALTRREPNVPVPNLAEIVHTCSV